MLHSVIFRGMDFSHMFSNGVKLPWAKVRCAPFSGTSPLVYYREEPLFPSPSQGMVRNRGWHDKQHALLLSINEHIDAISDIALLIIGQIQKFQITEMLSSLLKWELGNFCQILLKEESKKG